jgi:hypothetical protein
MKGFNIELMQNKPLRMPLIVGESVSNQAKVTTKGPVKITRAVIRMPTICKVLTILLRLNVAILSDP